MKKMLPAVFVVLLWGASIQAQTTLTGTWQGRTPSGFDLVLELRVADSALNGTLTRNGRSSTITDGNVSKNMFTFKASLDGQVETFTGELSAHVIKVWLDREGPAQSVTFKRSNPSLTGRWEGKTPNGFPLVLDLIAQENALTGTLTRNEQPATITEGKVSNNTFSFKVTLGNQTAGFTGELMGDQIKLWMDRQGPSAAAVLQRIADKK